MFYICGNALLYTSRRNWTNTHKKPETQELAYVSLGWWGNWKLVVVKYIIYLTKSWGMPYDIQTVAKTGQTSILICSETAHSFLIYLIDVYHCSLWRKEITIVTDNVCFEYIWDRDVWIYTTFQKDDDYFRN